METGRNSDGCRRFDRQNRDIWIRFISKYGQNPPSPDRGRKGPRPDGEGAQEDSHHKASSRPGPSAEGLQQTI
jgi:hypothetical protein